MLGHRTFLVTVHDPVCSDSGDRELFLPCVFDSSQRDTVNNALYGSFLPIPSEDHFPIPEPSLAPLAGEVICIKEKIKLSAGRKRWYLEVKNEGDRPIQVRFASPSTSQVLMID